MTQQFHHHKVVMTKCGYVNLIKTPYGFVCAVCGAGYRPEFPEGVRHMVGDKEFAKLEGERKRNQRDGRNKS